MIPKVFTALVDRQAAFVIVATSKAHAAEGMRGFGGRYVRIIEGLPDTLKMPIVARVVDR